VDDQAPHRESFGVLLSEIFLVLSVLSRGNDYIRLPVTSNLHRFEIIGKGTSFLARKIPRQYLPGISDLVHPKEQYFVYKSLRHFNREVEHTNDLGDDMKKLKNVLLEIQVLTHSPLRSHENIARLIGFGWETNRINTASHVFQWPFIVMEYAEHGCMIDVFEQHVIGYDTRRSLCADVGQGLWTLHSCDIVHGDLKMENILIFPHRTKGIVAKLADFGFASVDLEGKGARTKLPGFTIPWNAPEFQKTLNRNDLCLTDVYSYGLLIWRAMCYGHSPFTENGGSLLKAEIPRLTRLKEEDSILKVATKALDILRAYGSLFDAVQCALANSLQLDPTKRSLEACMGALG
jgi:serine/threonine protein kinase